MSLLSRFRALFKRDQFENNLDEELQFHVEMKTRENVEAGMSPEDARTAALRQFGSVALAMEDTRTAWSFPRLETVAQDFRYGLRTLAKARGFTVVAVFTLALGIGANTTIFSLISEMLLRKPPIQDPDRVMMPASVNPAPVWGADRYPVSVPDFLDWRTQCKAYSGMAASAADEFTLSGGTQPERVRGWRVTANFFKVLGVHAKLGRVFAPGEDEGGNEHTVILSEGLWKILFDASPRAIGRTVKINGEEYTVIGVVPSSFQIGFFPSDLWVPLTFTPGQLAAAGRGNRLLDVVARLKPGRSPAQAQAELAALAGRLAQTNPMTNKGWGARVVTLQQYLIEEGNTKPALLFLMFAVGFVLLIACANLANLLLARNSSRQREFTVRAALGAGRLRLAQQLLSECLLVSLAGAGLGLAVASFGLRVIRTRLNWSDSAVEMAKGLSIDGNVLIFTFAVAVGAALLFGLIPAFRISRLDLNSNLKESSRSATGGRERHRLQSLLVIGELALSLVLLVGAGLFVKGFIEEMQADTGINPHNLLTASVSLKGPAYADGAQQTRFFQEVLRRTSTFSEVQSAAVTSALPLSFAGKQRFELEDRPQQSSGDSKWSTPTYEVSPGYFETVRIPLIEGRYFQDSDNSHPSRVVIVSRAFARKYFDGQNPLGRHLRILHGRKGSQPEAPEWSEIVGVVGDVEQYPGEMPRSAQLYEPFQAHPSATMRLVVRMRTNPGEFAASLRSAVWAVDKDQAVTDVRSMDRVLRDSSGGEDLMSGLMSVFAGVALIMAALGIYGLLSYLIGRRAHEIGIRVALGAGRRDILRMVFRKAISLVTIGVAIGSLISLTLPRLFSASFTDFHVHAAFILAAGPVAVALVAIVSCYIPARRATKVDPMVGLRCE